MKDLEKLRLEIELFIKDSKARLINLWFVAAILILASGCSPKTGIVMQADTQPSTNPHIRFETDNLNELIAYDGFVVKYDRKHRVPAFVMHRITPGQLSDSAGVKAKRSNRFWIDQLNLADDSATAQDYRKSGYDRGHHAPAGDFVYSQSLKDESFVYSNISPQNAKLNRGALVKIERRIREKIMDCNCVGYVITGTYFDPSKKPKSIGENNVGVPTYIYKIAFYPKLAKMYGLVLDNTARQYSKDLFSFQKSIDAIELLTGEDFFEKLRDDIENRLEKQLSQF
jgi:endonuclease G